MEKLSRLKSISSIRSAVSLLPMKEHDRPLMGLWPPFKHEAKEIIALALHDPMMFRARQTPPKSISPEWMIGSVYALPQGITAYYATASDAKVDLDGRGLRLFLILNSMRKLSDRRHVIVKK